MRIMPTYDWRATKRKSQQMVGKSCELGCHQKVPERFRHPHPFLHHHMSSLRFEYMSSLQYLREHGFSFNSCFEHYCIGLILMHADRTFIWLVNFTNLSKGSSKFLYPFNHFDHCDHRTLRSLHWNLEESWQELSDVATSWNCWRQLLSYWLDRHHYCSSRRWFHSGHW